MPYYGNNPATIFESTPVVQRFNGDGSDELMGGYLYMNKAPNHLEFDKECKRLLSDIYMLFSN